MEEFLIAVFIVWVLWKCFGTKSTQVEKYSKPYQEPANSHFFNDSHDEELASFTIDITSSHNSETSYHNNIGRSRYDSFGASPNLKQIKTESGKCWVPKGTSVTIAGIYIPNGMIYVGSRLKAQRSYGGTDNCLINPKLKVANSSVVADDDHMSYWPSYNDIPPAHRRKYLEWLADGANSPRVNIGYVFLYFYGLERRLLLDQSVTEANDICVEIKRLMLIYGDNRSVSRYFSEAISCSSLIYNESVETPVLRVSQDYSWEIPIDVRIYIGRKLKQGVPISNEDMLLWFLNHPQKRLRTPATRLNNEFLALMKLRLAAKSPEGQKIRMPKRKISVTYSASSNSFTADLSKFVGDIPDISGLNAPITKTQKIVNGVMDELDKLSRLIGRNSDAVGTIKASALLPPELVLEFGGEDIQSLQKWLNLQQEDKGGVIYFSELIQKSTEHNGSKVTKAIHKEVQNVVESLGWNMLPAHNEVIGTIKPVTQALLAPSTNGALALETLSEDFQLAMFEITLGSYMAHADKRVLDVEIDHLAQRVESLNHLGKSEVDRLHAYVQWLALQEADFAALKRKLKTVDEDAKANFANIAIAIAAADGKIVPQEVRALETIYQSMGLEKQELFSSLHSMSTSGIRQPEKAFDMDQPANLDKGTNDNEVITLDMDRIAATLHDTAKASILLANIFEDDEPEPDQGTNNVEESIDDSATPYQGLDNAHAQLLSELLERNEWSRADYERLAESLKLMPDGAMETINEWAFDTHDDAIIEDDDPVIIYKELLGEGS